MSSGHKRAYSQSDGPPWKRACQYPVEAPENMASSSFYTTFPPMFHTPAAEANYGKEPAASQLADPHFFDDMSPEEASAPIPRLALSLDTTSLQDEIGMELDYKAGPVIYEKPDTVTSEQAPLNEPPTPSGLQFHGLSISDVPEQPEMKKPMPPLESRARTKVSSIHVGCLEGVYSDITPDEVILIFERGKEAATAKKHALCNASHYFANLLHNDIPPLHTLCIRLHNDFPFGLKALLQFLSAGHYTVDPTMSLHFPNASMLDLHIHAYLVGSKYEVPALSAHALDRYIATCRTILTLPISDPDDHHHAPSVIAGPASNPQVPFTQSKNPRTRLTYPSPLPSPSPYNHNNNHSIPMYAVLLSSFVLLWRNTCSRHTSALRSATLELIKCHFSKLIKLAFFRRLVREYAVFGEDVLGGLQEDGLQVGVAGREDGAWRVRFG